MRQILAPDGIRYVDTNYSAEHIEHIIMDKNNYIDNISTYPSKKFSGRGIVIRAGGVSYFTCCWILVSTLRKKVKCTLPIQIWYIGNELSATAIKNMEHLNVTFHDILEYENFSFFSGYQLKSLAILHSSFKEVLYLDADNVCIKDPEYLFNLSLYKDSGTIFWPDFWQTDKNNQIW